jgi:hypothetical protein
MIIEGNMYVLHFKSRSLHKPKCYLLYSTTALEELWPPFNEGFFICFNFIYTYFLLEAE